MHLNFQNWRVEQNFVEIKKERKTATTILHKENIIK